MGRSASGNDTVGVIARDLFASPILLCEWPDTQRLNAELKKVILERFESAPSRVQSARNAWQSDHDMHKWPQSCVTEFAGMLKVAASKMAGHIAPDASSSDLNDWQIVSCFANVNPPGGFSQPHNHIETGGVLSGVYYVDIGDCPSPSHAGRTILQDRSGVARPTANGRDPFSREYAVVPKPGVALLFTAAQMHYVEPYQGKGVRISIAFNLKHPNFDALYYPDMRAQTWWWRNFRGIMILRSKVPEKAKALGLFAKYLRQEVRRSGSSVPMWRRLVSARQRAEVDAQALSRPPVSSDGRLPEKQRLV